MIVKEALEQIKLELQYNITHHITVKVAKSIV